MNRRLNLALAVALSLAVVGACNSDTGSVNPTDTDGFNPDNAAPVVEVQAPAEGAVYQLGESVQIIARVSDDRDRAETLDVTIYSSLDELVARPDIDGAGFVSVDVTTLTVGNHELTVTARDAEGRVGEANVNIIINGAPVIPGLTIEPASPTSADELVAVIDGQLFDANRAAEELSVSWSWTRDGQDASVSGDTVTAAETAKGEIWKVTLKVRDALGTESIADASVTIANARPICAEAVLLPDHGGTNTDFTCTCATRRDADAGDPINDTCEFFDGDSKLITDGCSLPASETHKDMRLSCQVTPDDGEVRGPVAVTDTLIVENTPPPAAVALLTPATGRIRDSFTCSIAELPVDIDGDPVFVEYSWVVNGYENPGTSSTEVVPFDMLVKDDNATHVQSGDLLRCRVRTYDGDDRSAPSESPTVTLENTAPVGGIVRVGPLTPSEADTLTCTAAGAVDPDGDPVSWGFAWEVNGELLAGADEATLPPELTDIGDQVRCMATPTDGADDGAPVMSKNLVVIQNISPSTPQVALNAPFGAAGPVTCEVIVPSTDNGPFTSVFLWQINGGDEFEGAAFLDADQVDNCNTIRCRQRVDDGATVVTSNTAELTLPIGDCADDNPCTLSACLPNGTCATQPHAGPCDDGDFCTSNDTCIDGTCQGDPKSCDDGQFCTLDSCDPASGTCTNTLTDQMCADGNPCTDDRCSQSANDGAGGCVFDSLDDVPCDRDGNGCTVGDRCLDGECIAGARFDCDAGEGPAECFIRRCVSTGADSFTCEIDPYDVAVTCDDESWCTLGDHCDGAGACVAGVDRNCQQGLGTCQIGSCNEALDRCDIENIPDDTTCDNDSNGCTVGDYCLGGVCRRGAEADCSEVEDECNGSSCTSLSETEFSCAPAPRALGTPCSSDDFCTVNRTCDGQGVCGPGEDRDCDAEIGTQCTTAYCDHGLQLCVPSPMDAGTPCDDGDPCTQPDSCSFGECVSATSVCLEEPLSTGANASARPLIAHLGGGRYVTQWYRPGLSTNVFRVSNVQGSREGAVRRVGDGVVTGEELSSYHALMDIAVDEQGRFMLLTSKGKTSCSANSWCGATADRRIELETHGVLFNSQNEATASGDLVNLNVFKPTFNHAVQAGAHVLPLAYSDGSWGLLHSTIATEGVGYTATPARGVRYLLIGADLTPSPAVLLIDTSDTNFTLFHASKLPHSDDFLLAWVSDDGTKIMASRYDRFATQAPGGATEVAAADGGHTITDLRLHAFRDSGFAVVWTEGVPGGDQTIKALRTFPDYLGLSDYSLALDTSAGGSSAVGGLAAFDDGGLVVTWSNSVADSDGSAVLAQVFGNDGAVESPAFVVHVTESGNQRLPNVATLGGGHYVIVFVGPTGGVETRLFERPDRVVSGRAELEVSQTPQNDQLSPSVATDAAGHLFVAWTATSAGATVSDIYGRQYDADAKPMMAQRIVNATSAGAQREPSVAGDASVFAVAWTSDDQDGDGSGVFARVFPSDGTAPSAELQLDTISAGDQDAPVLASARAGGFLAAWASGGAIRARGLATTGLAPSAPVTVYDGAAGAAAEPALAPVSDGYLVGWYTATGISLKKVDAAGATLMPSVAYSPAAGAVSDLALGSAGGEPLACWIAGAAVECGAVELASLAIAASPVSVSVGGSPTSLTLTGLGTTGAFTVAWTATGVDGDESGILFRRVLSDSVATPRILANRYRTSSQDRAAVAAISSRGSDAFGIVWQSRGQDGDGWGVYLRALDYSSYGVAP